jgi:hypothetical protein
MLTMPEESERRQELRVKLPLRLWFNVLKSPDEYVRGRSAIPHDLQRLEGGAQLDGRDELERYMMRLDAKLNLIISLLTDNLNRKNYKFKASVVDISENGFKLLSPVKLPQGALLEMGLVLPNQPYRTLDILGEVVWETSADGKSEDKKDRSVGVRFLDIQPEDQDLIVHWIFQKQREDIRRSREQA